MTTSELGMWHIASVAHAAHVALCEALGDDKLPAWDDPNLPQVVRHFAMDSVRLQIANPGMKPSERHGRWVEKRKAEGWTLGPKDLEAKTHPTLRPYDELPESQRAKGRLFTAIVEGLRSDVR